MSLFSTRYLLLTYVFLITATNFLPASTITTYANPDDILGHKTYTLFPSNSSDRNGVIMNRIYLVKDAKFSSSTELQSFSVSSSTGCAVDFADDTGLISEVDFLKDSELLVNSEPSLLPHTIWGAYTKVTFHFNNNNTLSSISSFRRPTIHLIYDENNNISKIIIDQMKTVYVNSESQASSQDNQFNHIRILIKEPSSGVTHEVLYFKDPKDDCHFDYRKI